MTTRTVSFTLDDKKDNDICSWLDQQDGRMKSRAVREALRAYLRAKDRPAENWMEVVEGISRDVREIKTRIESGVVTSGDLAGPDDEWIEPSDITANLAKLIMQ